MNVKNIIEMADCVKNVILEKEKTVAYKYPIYQKDHYNGSKRYGRYR